MTTPRIVESAVVFPNGEVYTGKRHHNCFEAAHAAGEPSPRHEVQGFMTDAGEFVTREQAAVIAYKAGQIKKPVSVLFSEDLY